MNDVTRTSNAQTYRVEETRCHCHPETCCCPDYTVMLGNNTVARGYCKTDVERMVAAANRPADEPEDRRDHARVWLIQERDALRAEHIAANSENARLIETLRRIADREFRYSSDEDEDTQLSLRMADARAALNQIRTAQQPADVLVPPDLGEKAHDLICEVVGAWNSGGIVTHETRGAVRQWLVDVADRARPALTKEE